MLTNITPMRITRSFVIVATSVLLAVPFLSFAQTSGDFTFTPVLIDEKAKPRDILKQSLTIVNTSNRKLNLYPAVNDINPEEGQQGFVSAQDGTERAASLANWIELSRGVVELSPGEEKTIPFVIRVNLTAIAGEYHAYISFYEGGTREAAEQSTALGKITVNLEVEADVKEVMQLNSFFSDNIFFAGDDVLFKYQLENIGNRDLQPKGDIRVYDRKGKEVATVDVNSEGKTISPDEMSQLASVWSAASGFGRYKAFINVDYGDSQKASVQDTVYFWIIPWQQLVGMLAASLVAIIFFALYVHRSLDARYHAKFAHVQTHVPVAGSSKPAVPEITSMLLPYTEETTPEKKKPLFSFSRASAPPSVAEAKEAPKRSGLREALSENKVEKSARSHPHGAIDLTKMHADTAPKPEASHVIDLKNHS
ncbi:MAG: hypothetical protein WAZ27_02905 [Minisyncoccia bacterium]